MPIHTVINTYPLPISLLDIMEFYAPATLEEDRMEYLTINSDFKT